MDIPAQPPGTVQPLDVTVAGSPEVAAVLLFREVVHLMKLSQNVKTKEELIAIYTECLAAVRLHSAKPRA